MTRAIFITGGASGIGRATAQLFASRGWRVGIGDLAAPEAALPGVSFHQLDVRFRDQWATALADFCGTDKRLDVLVNNAGVVRYGRFEEVPQADSDLIVDVNLKGVINGCYAALAYLRATPGSAVVNVASSGAFYGGADLAVYCATKFGVRGLSEALDCEFAGYGVKVACVMPWFTESGMVSEPGVGRNASIKDDFGDQGFHGPEQPAAAIWKAAHGKALHVPVGIKARLVGALARFAPGLIRSSGRKRTIKARMP